MRRYLDEQSPFPWRKLGLVFEPTGNMYTHGSHPCIIHHKDDHYVLAFTRRDKQKRSHIFLVRALMTDEGLQLIGEPKKALGPGPTGYFDCDGVISVCFVKHAGKIYLYYVGWQNLPNDLWICDTGRAVLDIGTLTLEKEFSGPVFGRDKNNPLFAAATAFHVSEGKWQTWYNSGIRWEQAEQGLKHYYGIHRATSTNGIDWVSEPGMCIPFADEYEYAFGRPSVICLDETFYMWFAHRATKETNTYRMGFAFSEDGKNWTRNDRISGIDVSEAGWDSEMICYPYIFKHRNSLYMLYNGNDYGKTGFGLAALGVPV